MKHIIFIFIYSSLIAHSAYASKTKSMLDRTHEEVSLGITKLSNSIDEFFANEKYESNIKNKSKLILSFDTNFREGRGPYATPEINYRLILPKTQKKLQLFIENEDESTNDETEKNQFKSTKKNEDESDITTGLRYAIEQSGIKFSFDTGVLVNIPMVFFSKFRIKKSITFTKWVLKIREEVKWVYDKGFSSDLDLNFDKRLTRKILLRFVNNTYWSDQDYIIKLKNGPSLFHKLTKKSGLSYHAHAITINQPDFIVQNYITQISYRELIYQNWLYFQFTPFINFPRERNFHRTPGLVISFDAIFGYL